MKIAHTHREGWKGKRKDREETRTVNTAQKARKGIERRKREE
jgi:hypothetical protein